MKNNRLIYIKFILLLGLTTTAQNNHTIRGIVFDKASNHQIADATVVISELNLGELTNDEGHFVINDVPVGRYDIHVSYLGYEPALIREVLVSSGKEIFLEIPLSEKWQSIEEVIVRPKINKEEPINTTAIVSARMMSIEEANRYAGGFDDPACMASAFAGVAGNNASNAIAVRGNSPQFLQWRLEGVEIPNPTHYPDITGLGGGTFTALSGQVLGNSDFLTGAFPSEYSNALSGVFDINMRNGNRWEAEHSAEIGTLGIGLSSEGPFKKEGKSSYLFSYRYSTMALLGSLAPNLIKGAEGMRYQDLSFKMNFPTQRAGTFSFWGIGVTDKFSETPEDSSKWERDIDPVESLFQQKNVRCRIRT